MNSVRLLCFSMAFSALAGYNGALNRWQKRALGEFTA
jgi:hypothetical protein